jgi:hypothetical protein
MIKPEVLMEYGFERVNPDFVWVCSLPYSHIVYYENDNRLSEIKDGATVESIHPATIQEFEDFVNRKRRLYADRAAS